jgi:hypothetical protein
MKKFLVLYRMDMAAMQKMMESTSKEEREKGMAEWGMWMKKHAKDFADMGGPTGKNTQVGKSGASEMSNNIGGYSIVQAESKEAVATMMVDNPHFMMPGAVVDVMEVVPMGM